MPRKGARWRGEKSNRSLRSHLINCQPRLASLLPPDVVAPRLQIALDIRPRRASPAAKILRQPQLPLYEMASNVAASFSGEFELRRCATVKQKGEVNHKEREATANQRVYDAKGEEGRDLPRSARRSRRVVEQKPRRGTWGHEICFTTKEHKDLKRDTRV